MSIVLSHGCIVQAITVVGIATRVWLISFQGNLRLPYPSGAYPTRLEQLLRYQLGMWGAPREFYGQLYTKSYLHTTSVKISSM